MTKPKTAKPGAVMGRPTKFTEEIVKDILFLAAKGCIEKEIAQVLKIDETTLTKWKRSKDFFMAVQAAKSDVDALVRASLLSKAVGYDYEEEFATKDGAVMCKRVSHPDVTACRFWLTNRQPKQWRGGGEPEDEGKTVKNLFQLFVSVRDREQSLIKAGKDQFDVLFGEEFVKTKKKKQLNESNNSAKPSRRV